MSSEVRRCSEKTPKAEGGKNKTTTKQLTFDVRKMNGSLARDHQGYF